MKIFALTILSCLTLVLGIGLIKSEIYYPIHTVAGQSNTATKVSHILYGPAQPAIIPVENGESQPAAEPVDDTVKAVHPEQKKAAKPTMSIASTAVAAKPLAKAAAKPTPPPTPSCGGSFSQQFYCLLNQYRASKNLGSISPNSGLAGVAMAHSQWMSSTGTFSHTGLNGSRMGDRCSAAGITCRGENLALGAKSAQNLLDMWKASPAHNRILLENFSIGGLGISGSYVTFLLN